MLVQARNSVLVTCLYTSARDGPLYIINVAKRSSPLVATYVASHGFANRE